MRKVAKKICLSLLTVCCVLIYFPSSVRAQTPGQIIFQDDFEQGLQKWQPTRDDGSLWKVRDGKAEAVVEHYSTVTELVPKDEFWNSSWRNIEYELDFTPLEGVDRNISFGFQDQANWYEIHFVTDLYNIVHYRDGTPTLDIFIPYALANGSTYHVKIQHNLAHIQVRVNNVLIADAQDWAFDPNGSGKIGIKVGTGAIAPSRAQFDNIVVRLLEPEPGKDLAVPLLKQTDSRWADVEYDHASGWANGDKTTIRRWGCALTSMAMIMQHYGMMTLPDGQPLTPGTLNTWLHLQPDGFLGQGALNWAAVTRLTRIIHDRLNTPKLEYRRFAEGISFVRREIEEGRPNIVEIPGHFFVADGITGDYQDVKIKDPAYKYTKLSEHRASVTSVRQFNPSNTDLSYIVIAISPNVRAILNDPQGFAMNTNRLPEEFFTDPETGEHSPPIKLLYFPKPTNGRFVLRLLRIASGPITIQGFSYTNDATPTSLTLPNQLEEGVEQQFFLEYDKNSSPKFYQPADFQTFRDHLEQFHYVGDWQNEIRFEYAMQIAEFAKNSGPARQRRYHAALSYFVNDPTSIITSAAQSQLLQDLINIRFTLHLE